MIRFPTSSAVFLRVEQLATKPVLLLLVFQFPIATLIFTGFLFSVINHVAVRLDTAQQSGARMVIPSIAFTADHDFPDAAYNFVLVGPSVGVGIVAPSTALALRGLTNSENHDVINGYLVMARSLGAFMATPISTTTVQNVFSSALTPLIDQHEDVAERVKAVCENLALLRTLEDVTLQTLS
ncbi:uncharacterized protein BDR25DRAFT_308558 [Lindgomyces ingoldianus]|uniref:Uncharacterized protein n=1 Tax=Lindgomyces ingoldianus TaxID=673940 RepID=A0ACB6REV8_9PLEO|nr:uncharacterized protein BDR25DRAFT_308558 [Lindgomyces ingoldianus]KAF2477671.1 hypothetical protein BDR25DRAFT_308558 [Lindgomyces ingoldianus]